MGNETGQDVARQATNAIGAVFQALAGLLYRGAVLWALVGIVANQYDASTITTIVSVLSALLVAALVAVVLFVPLRKGRQGRSTETTARPGPV